MQWSARSYLLRIFAITGITSAPAFASHLEDELAGALGDRHFLIQMDSDDCKVSTQYPPRERGGRRIQVLTISWPSAQSAIGAEARATPPR